MLRAIYTLVSSTTVFNQHQLHTWWRWISEASKMTFVFYPITWRHSRRLSLLQLSESVIHLVSSCLETVIRGLICSRPLCGIASREAHVSASWSTYQQQYYQPKRQLHSLNWSERPISHCITLRQREKGVCRRVKRWNVQFIIHNQHWLMKIDCLCRVRFLRRVRLHKSTRQRLHVTLIRTRYMAQ